MKITETNIEGLLIVEPNVYQDKRGYFLEALNVDKLKKGGIQFNVCQENQAYSHRGVLRGLHFQLEPFQQGKLVRAVFGDILDVAVDIRVGSPSFGQYVKIILTGDNNKQLWIPPGFAHGALTISEFSLMAYYCTAPYSQFSSRSIKYNDPELNIDWEMDKIIVSEQDESSYSFEKIKRELEEMNKF